MVYEALTDGTWDLWVARPDGSESHRLTNLPGSERSAAWHPRLPFIYFESDGRTIWRVPIDASARATGPPERWLTLPDRLDAASDGIDFTPEWRSCSRHAAGKRQRYLVGGIRSWRSPVVARSNNLPGKCGREWASALLR